MSTDEGHLFFYSGESDRYMNGVSFLVHKDSKNTVLGCQPISGRLITIRLSATLFNIRVICTHLGLQRGRHRVVQNTINKAPKKDIITKLTGMPRWEWMNSPTRKAPAQQLARPTAQQGRKAT